MNLVTLGFQNQNRTDQKWEYCIQCAGGRRRQLMNLLACCVLQCRKAKNQAFKGIPFQRWGIKAKDPDSSIENMVSWQIQLIRIKCNLFYCNVRVKESMRSLCVRKKKIGERKLKLFLWLLSILFWIDKSSSPAERFQSWLGFRFSNRMLLSIKVLWNSQQYSV